MASETLDGIDWSHPHATQGSTLWAPRITQWNAGCKSQDLLHWVRRERASFEMPGQRTACAATEGIMRPSTLIVTIWLLLKLVRIIIFLLLIYSNHKEMPFISKVIIGWLMYPEWPQRQCSGPRIDPAYDTLYLLGSFVCASASHGVPARQLVLPSLTPLSVALIYFCIIIIIILESAVQGRERVRTLYQPKDPNPTQPTHGRKKKIKL